MWVLRKAFGNPHEQSAIPIIPQKSTKDITKYENLKKLPEDAVKIIKDVHISLPDADENFLVLLKVLCFDFKKKPEVRQILLNLISSIETSTTLDSCHEVLNGNDEMPNQDLNIDCEVTFTPFIIKEKEEVHGSGKNESTVNAPSPSIISDPESSPLQKETSFHYSSMSSIDERTSDSEFDQSKSVPTSPVNLRSQSHIEKRLPRKSPFKLSPSWLKNRKLIREDSKAVISTGPWTGGSNSDKAFSRTRGIAKAKPMSIVQKAASYDPNSALPNVEVQELPENLRVIFLKEMSLQNPNLNYQTKMKIGKGSFGVVFTAKDLKENTTVAIKILKMPFQSNESSILNEILMLKSCQHVNIVNYLHSYLYCDRVWVVMEYCDGGTLNQLVSQVNLCEGQIALICKQVLLGLEYLHNLQRVHRDLKSDNILLNVSGVVKIADLGLCMNLTGETSTQPLAGSRYWMAPEMIKRCRHLELWSCLHGNMRRWTTLS
eukprot:TRINITY_DN4410_c0_g1_i2.p1 TRINITY_DN4410_c0_g1~~TRINITY_DN4410_c0_g1_i2.p1  ORF type:complete len:489 (-),score=46.26 TRINITY_DN4410_c0_g1_i2:287-1753(-)